MEEDQQGVGRGKIMMGIEGALVLVFCGCNELPQTRWLKTTEKFLSQFWSPKVLKLRGHIPVTPPSGDSEGDSVPCFFPNFCWLLAVLGIAWLLDPSQ